MICRNTLGVLLMMTATVSARCGAPSTNAPAPGRSEVIGLNGMAATSHPLATLIAVEILREGGSAVDAAIAANAALGLMEPTGCGIGGDLFAMVWDQGRLHGINGSGRSPGGLTLTQLQDLGLTNMPSFGPLPVTVPGCVDAWYEMHGRFGRLPMSLLLEPAILRAREGFAVTPVIAEGWARNAERLESYPGFREQFMPGGRSPRAGEVFRNPALADTLERIAKRGRAEFYRGRVGQAIAEAVQTQGGYLTMEDLAAHRSEWVEPLSVRYRDCEVWELPPNGQGIAVLQMLNLLEPHDISSMGFGSADWIHLFVEAKKLVFEDRARFYADPAFGQIPVQGLIGKAYAVERGRLIRMDRAADRQESGQPALQTGDTIYLTTADSRGMMVSLIQSNYRGMGSGVIPEGTGFILQDRGELFDLTPGRPNSYAPGKRPFHTIIPAFVTRDGEPWLSFGVMGGDMQPQGQVQVLVNLLDFGMTLQQAGDVPRVYHTGSSEPTGSRMADGGTVNLEPGFSEVTCAALTHRGHQLGTTVTAAYGGYQAILWDRTNRVYWGASERRKDGCALGY